MGLLDALTSGLGYTTDTKQHEELQRKYYEQVQQAQPGGFYPSTASSWTTLNMNTATQSAYETIKLDEGAWDVPVSQLIDLWTVRYGSKWVKNEELDKFYLVAATRLTRLNKIEVHSVNGTNVYRIVE